MTVETPPPPRLADVPEPGGRDALRLVWWARRGYEHGARAGRGAGRTLSAVLAVLWWLAVPLSLPVQLALLRRRHARYFYMSPSRDAVLAVVATERGWHIEDHASARSGTGQGRALRARVMPELTAAADAAGVPIYTTAANEHLAQRYTEELPGPADGFETPCRAPRSTESPIINAVAVAALVISLVSAVSAIVALWYARASARAAAAVAAIEEARHAAEVESMSSAELILRKARRAELILVTNAGQHPASNVSVRYEGLLFRTLVEDDEAGLTLMPGETLELMPLIDWEHPRNRHMRDRGGIMGVPSWPLTLSWVDGRGSHEVKRRVADARGQDSADAKPSGSAE